MQSNSRNDKQNANARSGPVARRWQTDVKRFLIISAALALPFVVLVAFYIWVAQRNLDESRRPLFNNHTEIHSETGFECWVRTPEEFDGQGRCAFVDFKRNVIVILNSRDVDGQRIGIQQFATDNIVVWSGHDASTVQIDVRPDSLVVVDRDGSVVRANLNPETAPAAWERIKKIDMKQRDFRGLCGELLAGADRENAIAAFAR